MKYYIAEGTTPVGPFDIEELTSRGITPDTLVWAAGMTDWKPARTIDKLQDLFEPVPPPLTPPPAPEAICDDVTPPPYTPTEPAAVVPVKPFDWLWLAVAVTICCCSPLAIVGIIYGAQANGRWNRGEYDAAMSDYRKARIWTLVALGLSLIGNVLYAALYPSLLSSL